MIEQDSTLFLREYHYPSLELLNLSNDMSGDNITDELKNTAYTIIDTLKSFGIQTRIVDICRGTAITRYELQPAAGVQISKITRLANDIALNLASSNVTIAQVPGKAVIGVDIPNKVMKIVPIRNVIDSFEVKKADTYAPIALGKDILGNSIVADIAEMRHVLIAGTVGSGKSICIKSIILSLIYKSSPDDVKLLLIDPKVIELSPFNGLPHLLIPVVTDIRKAAGALVWAVTEMHNRYRLFKENQVRDLNNYNRLSLTRNNFTPLPRIIIVLDEFSDLMLSDCVEIEESINLLAQLGAASGMHLVIATQHLSKGMITEAIKANIPSRIAFAVSTQAESRTILGMDGAEKLLGRGDMLFNPIGTAKPMRVQSCFVSDTEIEQVVNFVQQGNAAVYGQKNVENTDQKKCYMGDGFDEEDEMLPHAIECVVQAGQASTSQLQRRLKLGYARAARIIDQLEEKGIVGPFEGSKPRQVLISMERWVEIGYAVHKDKELLDLQTQPDQPKVTLSQRKEVIETGKTVDIAIESACLRLCCKREQCEWEILEQPKKGFWRLKNTPAKVRVLYETKEP